MGYSYGTTRAGARGLACDGCGTVGGVRKRSCPHKVLTDSIRSADGRRHTIGWCKPPALCDGCFRAEGGGRAIHAGCKTAAAASQAREDAAEARWLTGEPIRVAAIRCDPPHGDWTDVTFYARDPATGARSTLHRYVTAEEYRALGYADTVGLTDYTTAVEHLPTPVPA